MPQAPRQQRQSGAPWPFTGQPGSQQVGGYQDTSPRPVYQADPNQQANYQPGGQRSETGQPNGNGQANGQTQEYEGYRGYPPYPGDEDGQAAQGPDRRPWWQKIFG
jgi:hypothetical protein